MRNRLHPQFALALAPAVDARAGRREKRAFIGRGAQQHDGRDEGAENDPRLQAAAHRRPVSRARDVPSGGGRGHQAQQPDVQARARHGAGEEAAEAGDRERAQQRQREQQVQHHQQPERSEKRAREALQRRERFGTSDPLYDCQHYGTEGNSACARWARCSGAWSASTGKRNRAAAQQPARDDSPRSDSLIAAFALDARCGCRAALPPAHLDRCRSTGHVRVEQPFLEEGSRPDEPENAPWRPTAPDSGSALRAGSSEAALAAIAPARHPTIIEMPIPLCPPIGSNAPFNARFASVVGAPFSSTAQPVGIGLPSRAARRMWPRAATLQAMSNTIGALPRTGQPNAIGLWPIALRAKPSIDSIGGVRWPSTQNAPASAASSAWMPSARDARTRARRQHRGASSALKTEFHRAVRRSAPSRRRRRARCRPETSDGSSPPVD